MDNNYEACNKFVLVHPELENDPDERRNEIGIIVSDNLNHKIRVSFQDNTCSNFTSDELFLLKPIGEIQQMLIDQGQYLSLPDLKALTQLDLMLRYGNGDKAWDALKLAANNPGIHEFCLDRLDDKLPIQKMNSRKR